MPSRSALLLPLTLVICSGGCRCARGSLTPLEGPRLRVSPSELRFSPTFLGQSSVEQLEVQNAGGTGTADLSLTGPFSVTSSTLEVAAGESQRLDVAFSPTSTGQATGTLTVGAEIIDLFGEGLELPRCAPTVCSVTAFDPGLGRCVATPTPGGSACELRCLTSGACDGAGVCVGAARDCTDGDACTVDVCDEAAGCAHAPVQCQPPSNPCVVSTCDRTLGCITTPVDDGSLCGPDDCVATDVDICLAGRCVARPRPDQGRCANRWVPLALPERMLTAMAFDPHRQKLMLFGGTPSGLFTALDDTWEGDGTKWTQVLPAASPPARYGHQLVTDFARGRVVLFGGAGTTLLNDTWEWDGRTWLARQFTTAPGPRRFHAMAADSSRRRVVLFSGDGSGADTWEYDGQAWVEHQPTHSPSRRSGHAMAYDEARSRVMLFGGDTGRTDTWEWDGTDWLERRPAHRPVLNTRPVLVFNGARQRVLLTSASGGSWEWDGDDWQLLGLPAIPMQPAFLCGTFDLVRQRVVAFTTPATTFDVTGASWSPWPPVSGPERRSAFIWSRAPGGLLLFGGAANGQVFDETWLWAGGVWTKPALANAPSRRIWAATAYDPRRRRVVLFGGQTAQGTVLSDTWEWDGSTWADRAPTRSPPGRAQHSLAFDEQRQRLVLFGGSSGSGLLTDTWEWDGSNWNEFTPALSPPARVLSAMAYDASSRRVVLFGGGDGAGSTLSDTWDFDGTSWALRSFTGNTPSARSNFGLATDSSRSAVLLFGGFRNGNTVTETWELAAGTWTQRQPTSSPSRGPLAFDDVRGRIALFDGTALWYFLP